MLNRMDNQRFLRHGFSRDDPFDTEQALPCRILQEGKKPAKLLLGQWSVTDDAEGANAGPMPELAIVLVGPGGVTCFKRQRGLQSQPPGNIFSAI